MKVSTKGRYALRVMADLALYDNGTYVSLKDISKRQDISLKYLEQIMRTLSSATLIQSARGSNGGYRLIKKAKQYSIYEILLAAEGSLALLTCVEDEMACERCQNCITISFWKQLNEHMQQFMQKYTLEDVIKDVNIYNYVI